MCGELWRSLVEPSHHIRKPRANIDQNGRLRRQLKDLTSGYWALRWLGIILQNSEREGDVCRPSGERFITVTRKLWRDYVCLLIVLRGAGLASLSNRSTLPEVSLIEKVQVLPTEATLHQYQVSCARCEFL
jgi:hypothetical protein